MNGVRSLVGALLAAVLIVGGVGVSASVSPAPAATAADGRDFNPGMIISDAVFYNGTTMSVAQIQAFLNARVPTCRVGYVCLKDYRQTTTSQPARSEGCAAYAGAANESAAQIISKVGRACGINPRALIVLLEKEQGLVTDTWPSSRQYRSATGYGCPDTAACDTAYYGFFNQVYQASWQFKKYRARPAGRGYQAGRTNTILWHPNAACGSSQVYIQNQATAGLYLYTPYRPNAAALANLYGTGDGCSSYGNRNFWRMFTDWFGSTSSPAAVRAELNETPFVYARDAAGDLWVYPGTSTGAWGAPTEGRQRMERHALRDRGGRPDRRLEPGCPCRRRNRCPVDVSHRRVRPASSRRSWSAPGSGDHRTRRRRGLQLRRHARLPDSGGERRPAAVPPGNGTGQFAPAKLVGAGWAGMTAIVGGIDFDGDGRTDILARDVDGALRLYAGDGRTGWPAPRVVGNGWSGMPRSLTPGDFDGDGADDVLARDSAGRLWLYPGDGLGGWKAKRQVGNGWGGFTVLAGPGAVASGPYTPLGGIGDLTSDGAADVPRPRGRWRTSALPLERIGWLVAIEHRRDRLGRHHRDHGGRRPRSERSARRARPRRRRHPLAVSGERERRVRRAGSDRRRMEHDDGDLGWRRLLRRRPTGRARPRRRRPAVELPR